MKRVATFHILSKALSTNQRIILRYTIYVTVGALRATKTILFNSHFLKLIHVCCMGTWKYSLRIGLPHMLLGFKETLF
jgi:hypothetical protein